MTLNDLVQQYVQAAVIANNTKGYNALTVKRWIAEEVEAKAKVSAAIAYSDGYAAGMQHMRCVSLDSAAAVEGDGEWHQGFKAAVADVNQILDREMAFPPEDMIEELPSAGCDLLPNERAVAMSPVLAAPYGGEHPENPIVTKTLALAAEQTADVMRHGPLGVQTPAVKYYMEPFSGDVGTLEEWREEGLSRHDLSEVQPDGNGGWVVVGE